MSGEARSSFDVLPDRLLRPPPRRAGRVAPTSARTPDGQVDGHAADAHRAPDDRRRLRAAAVPGLRRAGARRRPTGPRSGSSSRATSSRPRTSATGRTHRSRRTARRSGCGYPYRAEPGQRFEQSVTIRVDGGGQARPARLRRPNRATTDARRTTRAGALPTVGLGIGQRRAPLTEREQALLRALRLDHLRVDVRPSRPGWQAPPRRGRRGRRASSGAASRSRSSSRRSAARRHRRRSRPPSRSASADARSRAGIVFDDGERGHRARRRRARPRRCASGSAGGARGAAPIGRRHRWRLRRAESSAAGARRAGRDRRIAIEPAGACLGRPVDHGERDRAGRDGRDRADRSRTDGRSASARSRSPRASTPSRAVPPPPDAGAGELPSAVDHRQMSLLASGLDGRQHRGPRRGRRASVTWYETVGWRGLIERESGLAAPRAIPVRRRG